MSKKRKFRNSKKLWREREEKRLKAFQKLKKQQSNFQKGFALFLLSFLVFCVLIFIIGLIFEKYV